MEDAPTSDNVCWQTPPRAPARTVPPPVPPSDPRSRSWVSLHPLTHTQFPPFTFPDMFSPCRQFLGLLRQESSYRREKLAASRERVTRAAFCGCPSWCAPSTLVFPWKPLDGSPGRWYNVLQIHRDDDDRHHATRRPDLADAAITPRRHPCRSLGRPPPFLRDRLLSLCLSELGRSASHGVWGRPRLLAAVLSELPCSARAYIRASRRRCSWHQRQGPIEEEVGLLAGFRSRCWRV
jgi:hypothetical protein